MAHPVTQLRKIRGKKCWLVTLIVYSPVLAESLVRGQSYGGIIELWCCCENLGKNHPKVPYCKEIRKISGLFNPNWHELWKQEKCSSLATPWNMFYMIQWAWQGVKLTWKMSIFTAKEVWKFLIKIQLTKSDPKRIRGGKCPASCRLGLRISKNMDGLL